MGELHQDVSQAPVKPWCRGSGCGEPLDPVLVDRADGSGLHVLCTEVVQPAVLAGSALTRLVETELPPPLGAMPVPCRDPWCSRKGAPCGFLVDAHIKAHGPGILINAEGPTGRVADRSPTARPEPLTYARAVTPVGGECRCPGCDEPHSTVCVFGGRRTPGDHTIPPNFQTAPQPEGEPAMTTTTTSANAPADGAPGKALVVAAEPGSRLEALLIEYEQLKPLADAATARLKTVADGIKLEGTTAAPEAPKVDITSPVLTSPLRVQAKTSWRLDAKRMKAEDPLTYVRYAVQTTAWELRAVSNGAAA